MAVITTKKKNGVPYHQIPNFMNQNVFPFVLSLNLKGEKKKMENKMFTLKIILFHS